MRRDDEESVNPGLVERRLDDAGVEDDQPRPPGGVGEPHDRKAGGPGRGAEGAEEDQPRPQGDGFEPHDRLADASEERLEDREAHRSGDRPGSKSTDW